MTATTTTTTTTTTATATVSMMNRKRKQPSETGNWETEFYKNGYPAEVIVIEDSPTPPPLPPPIVSRHHQPLLTTRLPLTDLPTTPLDLPPSPSPLFPPSNSSTEGHHHRYRRRYTNQVSSSTSVYPDAATTTTTTISFPYSRHQHDPHSMHSHTTDVSSSYAAAAAAVVTLQACNIRIYRQHQNLANKRIKKDVPYLGLGHEVGQYSTTTTRTPTKPSIPRSLTQSYDDKDGHYIIIPNESLTARYKIMRLLGQGTFGRVVECYDRVRRTFCAVKVIRAIPKYRDASKIEIRVLNTLKEHDPLNLNKCIHLLEWFDYRNHICMVFELLGQSVFDFLKANHFKPFPSNHIQQFAKQLLTSVAFIHDLKLIHTDLKPENILLVNQRCHTGLDGNKQSLILQDTDIRLIDFGSATFEQDYHSTVVSTRHYRAPEIILGMGWSYPCDVWSIGCILVEFFTGDALFHTRDNLEHLAMMEAVIGMIPPHLIRLTSREGQKFFNGTKLKYPGIKTTRQSRQFVHNMKPLHQLIPPTNTLNTEFKNLIQQMLLYDPNSRISAREALRHPFFTV